MIPTSDILSVSRSDAIKHSKGGSLIEINNKQKTPRGEKSSTLYVVAANDAEADEWIAAIQSWLSSDDNSAPSSAAGMTLTVPKSKRSRSRSPLRAAEYFS